MSGRGSTALGGFARCSVWVVLVSPRVFVSGCWPRCLSRRGVACGWFSQGHPWGHRCLLLPRGSGRGGRTLCYRLGAVLVPRELGGAYPNDLFMRVVVVFKGWHQHTGVCAPGYRLEEIVVPKALGNAL